MFIFVAIYLSAVYYMYVITSWLLGLWVRSAEFGVVGFMVSGRAGVGAWGLGSALSSGFCGQTRTFSV